MEYRDRGLGNACLGLGPVEWLLGTEVYRRSPLRGKGWEQPWLAVLSVRYVLQMYGRWEEAAE